MYAEIKHWSYLWVMPLHFLYVRVYFSAFSKFCTVNMY